MGYGSRYGLKAHVPPPSRPLLRAACGGGLRPVLTAAARAAFRSSGRDGETALGRTEKLSPSQPGKRDVTIVNKNR